MPEEGEQVALLYIDTEGKFNRAPIMKVESRDGLLLRSDEYSAGGSRHSVDNLFPCVVSNGPAHAPLGLTPNRCFIMTRLKNEADAKEWLINSYVSQCEKVIDKLHQKLGEITVCRFHALSERGTS